MKRESIGVEDKNDGITLAQELIDCMDEDDSGCLWIHHPLVMCMGYDPASREQTKRLNRSLVKKKGELEKALKHKNWDQVLMVHEKACRFQALIDYAEGMTDEEYFQNLGDIWCQIENLWRHQSLLSEMLNPGDRDLRKRRLMMTGDERAVYDELPENVMIYRGCGPNNKRGWSWTLNADRARWFAMRGYGVIRLAFGGSVLNGRCDRESIIAYLGRRHEEEIVVDPTDVTIMEHIDLSDEN